MLPTEKSYMLGLCATDLYVRPYGRQIEVSVGSTRHEIIEMVLKTFGKYGKVYQYIYTDKNVTYRMKLS